MTGQEIINVTLVANTATQIIYASQIQNADIVNLGPGDVYVSWRKTATVGDANCLRLPEGMSYELRASAPWNTLSIIGSQAAAVQVVVR